LDAQIVHTTTRPPESQQRPQASTPVCGVGGEKIVVKIYPYTEDRLRKIIGNAAKQAAVNVIHAKIEIAEMGIAISCHLGEKRWFIQGGRQDGFDDNGKPVTIIGYEYLTPDRLEARLVKTFCSNWDSDVFPHGYFKPDNPDT
jgi:hypothetical protein